MTLSLVPDVPAPAGAIGVYDWDQDDPNSPGWRSFDLASWEVENDEIAVDLSGVQYADGSIRLETLVHFPQRPLTVDEARRLSTALHAATVAGDDWAAATSTTPLRD